MALIEDVDMAETFGRPGRFEITRAIIQKGRSRLMVYFWFDQAGQVIAGDFAVKANLLLNGMLHGRTDGGVVRLITPIIGGDAGIAAAEERLQAFARAALDEIPRFVPGP